MIDTDLYIALGGDESKKRLRKAQKRYLKTLSYDDGTIVKNKSDRYYDLGGILNAAGPMAKSILSDSLDTTYDKIKAQKEYNNRSVLSGISDNNSLLDMFDNIQWADNNYTNKDFRKASLFDDISDVIMGAGSGATASGSWIGAAVGAGLVGGKKLFDVFRAKKEKDKANADASNFNAGLSNMIGQVADNVDTLNDRLLMQNYFNQAAFGGSLGTHGSDFSNGLVQINAGGTHESNPNEGVPAGIAPDGTPNLVEEGEVIWNNDYVFSNRIKVPAKLRNKYKLGGGLSFADAIKEVTKESEDRKNDPISNATTRKIVEEFIDAQEEIRNERQQRALSELQQAQAESDFINALSQVSPVGASNPMQLQTPVAPETNEPPVIEGMACGGHKFARGGIKRKGGMWIVPSPNGDISFPRKKLAEEFYYALYEEPYRPSGGGDGGGIRGAEQQDNIPDLPDVEEQTAQPQQEQIEGTGSAQEPIQETEGTDVERQTPPTPPAQSHTQLPTIPYNRGINGADFEAQQYYQNFLRYIQDPKNSGEVNDWINKINNDIAASGSSYKVKNLNDLIRLATDQKVGPVHQAFNRIANEWGNANASRPFNISEDENNYNSLVDKLEALGVDTSNIPMYGYDQNGNPIGTAREGFGLPRVDNELNRDFDRFNQAISRGRAMQGWLPSSDNGLEDALAQYNAGLIGRKSGRQTLNNPYLPQPSVEETTEGSGNTPNGNTGNTGNTDWMRKAPIFGSALGVATGLLGNPDYSNADAILEASERMGAPVSIPVETIGDYVQRRPFDERYLVNMANQNRAAASRSIANTSGGNRAMQLGADYALAHNNQQELGEIMRQAYLANRQDMFNTAEFNRGTNLQNMSAINQRNLSQAQLNSNRQQAALSGLMTGRQMRQGIRNAWDAATSQNLSNLFTNIGLLGRENVTDNMIRSMVENGFGNLMMNKDGTMTFIPTGGTSANGGKLKKKRRF